MVIMLLSQRSCLWSYSSVCWIALRSIVAEHKSEPTADILETLFIQKLQFSRLDSHEVCKHILDYWKKKRKELGKPLLRRYWPLTNVNDTNPNLVFRPRSKVNERERNDE